MRLLFDIQMPHPRILLFTSLYMSPMIALQPPDLPVDLKLISNPQLDINTSTGKLLTESVGSAGLLRVNNVCPVVPLAAVLYPSSHEMHVLPLPGEGEPYLPCGQATHPLVPETLEALKPSTHTVQGWLKVLKQSPSSHGVTVTREIVPTNGSAKLLIHPPIHTGPSADITSLTTVDADCTAPVLMSVNVIVI